MIMNDAMLTVFYSAMILKRKEEPTLEIEQRGEDNDNAWVPIIRVHHPHIIIAIAVFRNHLPREIDCKGVFTSTPAVVATCTVVSIEKLWSCFSVCVIWCKWRYNTAITLYKCKNNAITYVCVLGDGSSMQPDW